MGLHIGYKCKCQQNLVCGWTVFHGQIRISLYPTPLSIFGASRLLVFAFPIQRRYG